MANVWAIKSGNWSDPTVWNTGALPGNGDTVAANGYTVTIDMDLVGSYAPAAIQTSNIGDRAGGSFVIASNRQIGDASHIVEIGGSGSTTTVITIQSGNYDVTFYANITGGSGSNAYGIYNVSTGTVTVTGNVTGGSSTNTYGIQNYSSGTVNVTGNVTGGANWAYGIYNISTGTVTVTGNVTGGSAVNAYGIQNYSSGTVNVTGNVTGGSGSNTHGIQNYSSGTVNVTGIEHRGKSGVAVYSTNNGTLVLYGDCYADPSPAVYWIGSASMCWINGNRYGGYSGAGAGVPAVVAYKEAIPQSENITIRAAKGSAAPGTFSDEPAWFYGAGVSPQGHPTQSDVRYGVSYGPNNELTGTCRVPPPQSVLYGVPVDNTTGTAIIDADSIASAVWNAVRSSYSTPGTFGAVSEWAGSVNAGEIADAVWDALRSEHTGTGTFGAVSEWAGGGGTADWTDAEKQQIRYRLGIDGTTQAPSTNAPHLGSNYSTLDDLAAHVSTRLAASAYTAPDNASISAIKSKTDKLTFDTNNYVYAIATNAVTDWTDNEKKQIRHRLGIDGASEQPSATPSLSTLNAQQVWEHTNRTLSAFGFEVTVGDYATNMSPSEQVASLGYTSDRASKLDNLDATISSRAPANTALSNTVWTDARAEKLDNLDAAVSSRLAASSYIAPDNASITAIKTKTDQLSFDSGKVLAKVSDPVTISSTDVSAIVDGVWDEPAAQHTQTGSTGALLGAAGSGSVDYNTMAQAVWQYATRELTGFSFQVTVGTNLDKTNYTLTSAYDRAKDALKYTEYTAPDNTGIAAIKAQTDKLSFTGTDVKATLDGETVTVANNLDKSGYALTSAYDRAKDALKYTEYTAPDNTSITTIKTKTDQLNFDTGKVLAKVNDPVNLSSTDVNAIVDGIWDEPISQHTTTGSAGAVLAAASDDGTSTGTIVCSPVIYPLQLSTAPRTSGPSITWYSGEKPAASFVIKSTDLTTKDVVLSVFALANPQEVLLEAAGSVAYSEATLTSTVNISLDELALAPSFAYRYILKNVTDDTVLASGPLYVISVPA